MPLTRVTRSRQSLSADDDSDSPVAERKSYGGKESFSREAALEMRRSPRNPAVQISPKEKKWENTLKMKEMSMSVDSPAPEKEEIANVLPNIAALLLPTKGRRGRKSNAQKALEREMQAALLAKAGILPSMTGASSSAPHEAPKITSVTDIDGDPKYDIHPLKIGHHLVVRYRDRSDRLARIVDQSVENQYYIHYLDFNRRMDEWVAPERIVSLPSIANKLAYDYLLTQAMRSSASAPAVQENLLSTIADLDHDEHEGLDEESLLEHEKVTKVKNIRSVQLGKYIMECWYFSPFPREYYPNGFTDCLYFCEFSMRFFRTKGELIRYQSKPGLNRYPPGHEIYRDENVSMFEIDGAIEKIYSQNLCYFAKLFLDHKTLYWDVDQFLFYVLCTQDERGYHPVGYFSKEKFSELGYNLACILTFPCYQRKGYGRVLMEFSYELSKKEEKIGSPEKPLSDLGAVGYRSYWASVLLRILKNHTAENVSIIDIACMTSIQPEDIVSTLIMLGLLQRNTGEVGVKYIIVAPPSLLDELIAKYPENKIKIDSTKLHWAPFYVMDAKKDKWSIASLRTQVGGLINSTGSNRGSSASLFNLTI